MTRNSQVVLASRPDGRVREACFSLRTAAVPRLSAGEVLVENMYLSCDPYLRRRMDGPFAVGEVVPARAVGRVVASSSSAFDVGDHACGTLGWEHYSVADGALLTRVDPGLGPLSHAISVRGLPGLTAYVGMIEIGRPSFGDNVIVSAGSGAVGSVAGQLARLSGARVVAIVGGPEKAKHAVDALGYHAAIDHREPVPLKEAIDRVLPGGVDVCFENVGGPSLDGVLDRLRAGARVALCGMAAGYDSPTDGITNLMKLIESGSSIKGFRVHDHLHKFPDFSQRMAKWITDRRIVYFEDIVDGIENLPEAFVDVLEGRHIGKRLVRVSQ